MPKITKAKGPSYRPSSYPIGMLPADDDSNASSESNEQEGAGLGRPPLSANKPRWVAYAEALGLDSSGTKDQIIARVDAAGG